MGKIFVFDMDGTLADLYGVADWLPKLRAEDSSPYTEAAPMWDMDALREILLTLIEQGNEVRVVSWLAKDSTPEYKAAVRRAKREWLTRYNFPAQKIHLVQYGTRKSDCVRDCPKGAGVLFDDSKAVCKGWHLGETVDPQAVDILEYLMGCVAV